MDQKTMLRLTLAGLAAIGGGGLVITLGLGDEPLVAGGVWKGVAAALLGFVLLVVVARAAIRENR